MTFKEQLNALSAVKFPLILAVVCVHIQNSPIPMTFDWYYVKFFAECVGRVGVPLFFAISGYMFFCNIDRQSGLSNFCYKVWPSKMLRRVRTLMLPYMLWNAISLLFIWVKDCYDFSLGGGGARLLEFQTRRLLVFSR